MKIKPRKYDCKIKYIRLSANSWKTLRKYCCRFEETCIRINYTVWEDCSTVERKVQLFLTGCYLGYMLDPVPTMTSLKKLIFYE